MSLCQKNSLSFLFDAHSVEMDSFGLKLFYFVALSFEKMLYICKVIGCEVLAEPFCPRLSLLLQPAVVGRNPRQAEGSSIFLPVSKSGKFTS